MASFIHALLIVVPPAAAFGWLAFGIKGAIGASASAWLLVIYCWIDSIPQKTDGSTKEPPSKDPS